MYFETCIDIFGLLSKFLETFLDSENVVCSSIWDENGT